MPISNYPNGFSKGVNILGLPLLNTYAGEYNKNERDFKKDPE